MITEAPAKRIMISLPPDTLAILEKLCYQNKVTKSTLLNLAILTLTNNDNE